MDGDFGDEVHPPTKHDSEFVRKILDLPSELGAWTKFVEKIDVAVACGVASRVRAEHLETRDSEALTDFSQALEVDVQLVDGHYPSVRA
jgi:hypothetical protein